VAEVVLIRHGETEWSAGGRHTSWTDVALTERGRQQAKALAGPLAGRRFAAVLCSPRLRARSTAELAGLAVSGIDPDLVEWDYGRYEGLTTPQVRQDRPDWSLWTDGAPGGESPEQITARVDRALDRIRDLLSQGDVAVVAHGHVLRVTGARWIGLSAHAAGALRLDTAATCVLGFDHGRPAIDRWNLPAAD
jgi:broad specificity phosphatase PhoE